MKSAPHLTMQRSLMATNGYQEQNRSISNSPVQPADAPKRPGTIVLVLQAFGSAWNVYSNMHLKWEHHQLGAPPLALLYQASSVQYKKISMTLCTTGPDPFMRMITPNPICSVCSPCSRLSESVFKVNKSLLVVQNVLLK